MQSPELYQFTKIFYKKLYSLIKEVLVEEEYNYNVLINQAEKMCSVQGIEIAFTLGKDPEEFAKVCFDAYDLDKNDTTYKSPKEAEIKYSEQKTYLNMLQEAKGETKSPLYDKAKFYLEREFKYTEQEFEALSQSTLNEGLKKASDENSMRKVIDEVFIDHNSYHKKILQIVTAIKRNPPL